MSKNGGNLSPSLLQRSQQPYHLSQDSYDNSSPLNVLRTHGETQVAKATTHPIQALLPKESAYISSQKQNKLKTKEMQERYKRREQNEVSTQAMFPITEHSVASPVHTNAAASILQSKPPTSQSLNNTFVNGTTANVVVKFDGGSEHSPQNQKLSSQLSLVGNQMANKDSETTGKAQQYRDEL